MTRLLSETWRAGAEEEQRSVAGWPFPAGSARSRQHPRGQCPGSAPVIQRGKAGSRWASAVSTESALLPGKDPAGVGKVACHGRCPPRSSAKRARRFATSAPRYLSEKLLGPFAATARALFPSYSLRTIAHTRPALGDLVCFFPKPVFPRFRRLGKTSGSRSVTAARTRRSGTALGAEEGGGEGCHWVCDAG